MENDQHSAVDISYVCEQLASRRLSMDQYVEQLKDLLTSVDSQKRIQGFGNLHKVLTSLPEDHLNNAEVNYLAHFFASFLQDHYVLAVSLRSVYFLVHNYVLADEEVCFLFTTLSKEVPVTQQPIDDRFIIYQLLGDLLEKHSKYLDSIKYDFVIGFIQMVEGERDPRCLLVVFKLFQKLVTTVDIGHLDEELFETISCYFPITYSPPLDSKLTISRSDLTIELENCFKASEKFGPYAVPLFIDKLESELSSSRIDAYTYLKTCSPIYGSKCLANFLETFWVCVRVDALKSYSKPTSMIEAALDSLKSVAKTVAVEAESYAKLLHLVFDDTETSLKKLELYLLKPAVEILKAVASASGRLWERVAGFAFPILLEQFAFRDTSHQSEILLAIATINEIVSSEDFDVNGLPHDEAILIICLHSLTNENTSLNTAAYKCIKSIIMGPWRLSDSDQLLVSKKLLEVLSTGIIEDAIIGKRFSELLNCFSMRYQEVVKNYVLSFFFGVFEDYEVDKTSSEMVLRGIDAAKFALVDTASTRRYISFAVKVINSTTEANANEPDMVFEAVCKALKQVIGKSNEENLVYDCCLIPVLKTIAHLCLCDDSPDEVRQFQSNRMSSVFELLPAITKKLTKKHSMEFVDAVTGLILKHSYVKLLPEPPPSCHCDLKKNMENEIYLNEPYFQILIRLIHTLFVNVKMNFHLKDAPAVVKKLLSFTHHSDRDVAKLSIESLAALLNKVDNSCVTEALDLVVDDINETFKKSKEESLEVLSWCHKALVINAKPTGTVFTQTLLRIMNEESEKNIVSSTAKTFIFVHERTDVLNEESNANISSFYHQRFYLQTLPLLLEGFTKHQTWKKQAFAHAILGQLKHLSKDLLKGEVKKLRNIITFGVDECNGETKEIALECVSHIITTDPEFLENSIEHLTLQVLSLLNGEYQLEVRRKAAECLLCISSSYSERKLLPLRNRVLKVLSNAVADRKRIVRYIATDAKLKWILIGQPK